MCILVYVFRDQWQYRQDRCRQTETKYKLRFLNLVWLWNLLFITRERNIVDRAVNNASMLLETITLLSYPGNEYHSAKWTMKFPILNSPRAQKPRPWWCSFLSLLLCFMTNGPAHDLNVCIWFIKLYNCSQSLRGRDNSQNPNCFT